VEARTIADRADGRAGVDELRAQLHGMWAGVAGSWAEHSAFVDIRGAVLTERMLELSDPRRASAYSSWRAGPEGWGWQRPRGLHPRARLFSPTWRPR
jgi:hypothetical protein